MMPFRGWRPRGGASPWRVPGSRRDLRRDVSLNPCSDRRPPGRRSGTPTRARRTGATSPVVDPERPRHRRLHRRHVRHDHDVLLGGGDARGRRRPPVPGPRARRRRLPARRPELEVGAPRRPCLGRACRRAARPPAPVVELDPPLVDLDGRARRLGDGGGRRRGNAATGWRSPAGPGPGRRPLGERRGLGERPRRRGAGRPGRAGGPAALSAVRPCADEEDHGRSRPVAERSSRRAGIGQPEGPPHPPRARRCRPPPSRRARRRAGGRAPGASRRTHRRPGTATRRASPSPTCRRAPGAGRCRSGTPEPLAPSQAVVTRRQHDAGQQSTEPRSVCSTNGPPVTSVDERKHGAGGDVADVEGRALEHDPDEGHGEPDEPEEHRAPRPRAGDRTAGRWRCPRRLRLALHGLDLGGRQRQVAPGHRGPSRRATPTPRSRTRASRSAPAARRRHRSGVGPPAVELGELGVDRCSRPRRGRP